MLGVVMLVRWFTCPANVGIRIEKDSGVVYGMYICCGQYKVQWSTGERRQSSHTGYGKHAAGLAGIRGSAAMSRTWSVVFIVEGWIGLTIFQSWRGRRAVLKFLEIAQIHKNWPNSKNFSVNSQNCDDSYTDNRQKWNTESIPILQICISYSHAWELLTWTLYWQSLLELTKKSEKRDPVREIGTLSMK